LHLKDILDLEGTKMHKPVPKAKVRPLAILKSQDSLRSALTKMQRSGAHLAQVESKGTILGVATLEDILEELVGEIHDDSQKHTHEGQSSV